jgi:hypothetical protein
MVKSVTLVVNATDASWIATLLAQTFRCQNVRMLPSLAIGNSSSQSGTKHHSAKMQCSTPVVYLYKKW